MDMKVKGTVIITMPGGAKALILLATALEDLDRLHHYLTIDAYRFKKEVSESIPGIEFISAGFKNNKGEFIWNDDYIPIPKWYENN